MLNPLKDVHTSMHLVNQINLLTYNEFVQAYKEEGIPYALVAVEKIQDGAVDVPNEVAILFKRFKRLAPDELPPGLPPLRDI